MKWRLRNKHRNSKPGCHLPGEMLKVLWNVACFLRLLKVTSFKCSSNAANVSDPVFLLFIISLTSSLTKKNVKRGKTIECKPSHSRLGSRCSRHTCSLRKNPTLVSPWNDIWGRSPEIPYWWCVTTKIWVMPLIGENKFSSQHDQLVKALPRSGWYETANKNKHSPN